VPIWLDLLRLAVLAGSLLMAILYYKFPDEERQKRAAEFIANRLVVARSSLSVLLRGAAWLLQDALGHLYGRAARIIVVSTCLTLVYISLVVALNWNWIVFVRTFSEEKLQIDQSVDPTLRYLPDDIKRAKEYRIGCGPGACARMWMSDDYLSRDIRESFDEATARWFAKLKGQPHARDIAFLTLFQGYSWDHGLRLSSISGLLIFNIIFYFFGMVVVRAKLEL